MFQNSFPVVGTMTQSRFAYFTFHLLTFSSVVKLHATPVTESCRFHTDAYKQYANLIARGQGTVPIHNLTCICFVGTPQISILYPAADDSPDPDIEISPYDCQGVAWPCGEMPQTCAGIQENVFSYRSISGIFNKTAVITCKSARNSNKADPFIVWVEPAVTSIPSSSDTTSSFTMTTTTTIITTFSKVSSLPEMSKSIDYSTSVSPMTTAVTSQPPTETLSTQHTSSATPSPTTTPPTSLSLRVMYTFVTTSTYAASASANNDCSVTVSTCILDPDVGRITAPTVVPTDNPIAAVVAAALVVVALMIIIFVLLIVLIVVLKKRQKQVEKDYKTPPPNSELQESIMLKNNATK